MFSISDTIVAIATPPGRGGLGVVRVSGPDAERIAGELVGRAKPFQPRHATFARFPAPGSRLPAPDQVVVTVFKKPQSYTGEDVAEISAHGSPVVLSEILTSAIQAGARLAEPGEFTLRAFLNGKLDLIQAEAVADVINAVTPLQARAAFDQLEGTLTAAIGAIESDVFDVMARLEASLDFPEEGYHFVAPREASETLSRLIDRIDRLVADAARGRLIREGAQVAIVGSPNVGKSSLFNALLNANRAIVTAVPGTTRDLLTERADIGGLSLALIDTAGLRDTADVVEHEGVARAQEAMQVADLILIVLDRSRSMIDDERALVEQTADRSRVIAINKGDLAAAWRADQLSAFSSRLSASVEVSAKSGAGLDRLVDAIARALNAGESLRDRPAITNIRHATLLSKARESLARAATALESGIPEEFPLVDLQDASQALQEIRGTRTTDDLLQHIFSTFCIGK